MKRVYSLLVDNTTGVLSRISGLFSRRGYSIDSITAGVTADPRFTRITIVASGDELILSQIEKQVRKLEDVIEIKVLKEGESVYRELIMVKVKADAAQRAEIISVADIFRAKVVDVEKESLMLELTGNQSKLEAFLNLLDGYEILHRMIRFLSKEDQKAIQEAEATGHFDSPAYLAANDRFMLRHCAGEVTEDSPECLRRPKKSGSEAYLYGWGPNEYNPTGSLGNWEYTDKLDRITCPALIINGTNDLCTPLVAKTMYDRIPNAKWELFDGCRHMCFVEENKKYIQLLTRWMDETEKGLV